MVQSYAIFLSTFSSINRQQLTIFDAHIVLSITSSPFIIQLVFSAMFDLVGHKTQLYRGLGPAARYIRWLSLLMLPIWLALSVITVRSPTAFIDSYVCRNTTAKDWFHITFQIIGASITNYALGFVLYFGFIFVIWIWYFIFHLRDMKVAYDEMGKEYSQRTCSKLIKVLCVSLISVTPWILLFTLRSRDLLRQGHPCLVWATFMSWFFMWGMGVMILSLNAPGVNNSYVLSYGQVTYPSYLLHLMFPCSEISDFSALFDRPTNLGDDDPGIQSSRRAV